MLPAPQVTLSMSEKIASILGPQYGWSLWKNEDLLADLVEFACDIARTSAHSTRFVDLCARYVLMLRALFSSGTKI